MTQPKIGAYVLETLTTGMYSQPLDSIRELIQNASDSIRNAERSGILKPGEGRISASLDRGSRRLVISDNGEGVVGSQAADRLINIGMSDKPLEFNAGFRGIGRLAAIAYCDRMRFVTSAPGEDDVTTVEFDCVGIREAIRPANRHTEELSRVIDKYSSVSHDKGQTGSHFFEVHLDKVSDATDSFLDVKELEQYLAQVAPVDFDPQRFLVAPKIKDWLQKNGLSIPTVTLVIEQDGNSRVVFKPYGNSYMTSKQKEGQYQIRVEDVLFYPESLGCSPDFWVWYGKTQLLGTIGDELSAGFRLRKDNIALGGAERVAELFAKTATTNARFNRWYIGEVHVLNPEIIPNARRDGFEQNDQWLNICEKLTPFIRQRCSEPHQASSARSRPVEKLRRSVQSTIERASERVGDGVGSEGERNKVLQAVTKEKKKAEAWVKASRKTSDASEDEIQEITEKVRKLNQLVDELQAGGILVAERLKEKLSGPQRKLLQEIFEIIHSTLDRQVCPRSDACYEELRSAIVARYDAK